ncbi:CHAT domain-containing protein [Pedobacter africanus]|uniref:CHAT domain-containing protein n=1 Tax=Pedobacter africanus TaxID=151894 RepID=A0A1W1ZRN2_9SPHI|nr:CHAT domain-containing protein [Pedobacter africanus]SMC50728.1 CHAT domain-containing protein [Pedobacter africanus]
MEILVRFWILLVCLSFSGSIIAQTNKPAPPGIVKSLDSLEKLDNLSEWIYTRIDYSYQNPGQSLSFLMESEAQSWRSPKSVAEKEAWLMLLSNQAYNQLYSGNILQSINCYEQAYNYYTKHKLNVEGIAEYVLKPWANNYTRLGDYEKALFIQQKTLDFAKKEHNDVLTIAVYNNMAISYRSLGDFQKAEACITQGTKKSKPSSAGLILLSNTLADIHSDKNELDLAEKVITANINRQKNRKPDFESAYWLLSSYITAGDIQLKKQLYAKARTYYQQALVINNKYYKGNRLREKAYILIQLGKINLDLKQARPAQNLFNDALALFGLRDPEGKIRPQRIFGDNRLIDVFYQRALAFGMAGMEEEALESIRFSLLSADKIRFELADVKTKQRFQQQTRLMAEKAMDMALGLLQKTGRHQYAEAIVQLIEQTKARILLDDIRKNQQQLSLSIKDPLFQERARLEQAMAYNEREILQNPEATARLEERNAELKFKLEDLEKNMLKQYPSFAISNDNPVATDLLQLPSRAHFVEFFMGAAYIYVVEIANRRVKHVKRIRHAENIKKQISSFVRLYYQNGPAAMMNQPKAFFLASHQLYNTLLGGFNFPENKNLIIIPDEVTGYLSFDGLITRGKYTAEITRWPFLINACTITYAFSIQTWLNQAAKKINPGKKFEGLFISHRYKSRQFIPAVAREAKAMEKIVKGKFRSDEAAGVNDFFKAFDNTNVLHISTHSYLSGAQKEPTLAFNDNEVYLFELSSRKTAPDLVVLSACRTADGAMSSGEGIISMSRGFAALGTGGTIAGLWNVNDRAASEITASCYSNMLAGQKISTALRHAKLQWLHQPQRAPQEYLPYYWDALIYMGYDRKIELRPAGNILADYGKLSILVITALCGIYYLIKIRRKTISPASV